MAKRFNVTDICKPKANYMVNIDNNFMQIKRIIDCGDYFTIIRASFLSVILAGDYDILELKKY